MKWNDLSEIQRNALVAERIMGWQWIPFNFYDVSMDNQSWLLPRERATAHLTSGEWTWYIEEPVVYPEGSSFPLPHKDNRILPTWIPHYTTSMDAAWLVLQQMTIGFDHAHMYGNEPFFRFQHQLFGTESEEIYPAYRLLTEQIARWTPEQICQAAYEAARDMQREESEV